MKLSSQIAAPAEGVHFVDPRMLPGPKEGDVCVVQVLNGKVIAGVWVDPEHGGTAANPSPELVEGAWVFWNRRHEATCCDAAFEASRPAPRLLELL
jgi:hypothetical protein